MAKRYKIQFGNAAPEEVGQDVIDRLKAKQQLDRYSVEELKEEAPAPKPADLGKKQKEGDKPTDTQ